MKPLPNLLRVVLVDPPSSWADYESIEPRLETRDGSEAGVWDGNTVRFETRYRYEPTISGPAFKREGDGRRFVYIGWYGTKSGLVERFRRLKVHLEKVPNLTRDCEVHAAGKMAKDGSPACATATILQAKNLELPEGLEDSLLRELGGDQDHR